MSQLENKRKKIPSRSEDLTKKTVGVCMLNLKHELLSLLQHLFILVIIVASFNHTH